MARPGHKPAWRRLLLYRLHVHDPAGHRLGGAGGRGRGGGDDTVPPIRRPGGRHRGSLRPAADDAPERPRKRGGARAVRGCARPGLPSAAGGAHAHDVRAQLDARVLHAREDRRDPRARARERGDGGERALDRDDEHDADRGPHRLGRRRGVALRPLAERLLRDGDGPERAVVPRLGGLHRSAPARRARGAARGARLGGLPGGRALRARAARAEGDDRPARDLPAVRRAVLRVLSRGEQGVVRQPAPEPALDGAVVLRRDARRQRRGRAGAARAAGDVVRVVEWLCRTDLVYRSTICLSFCLHI